MHLQRKVKYPTTISPTSMGTKQNQKMQKQTFLSPFLEPSLKRPSGMTTARVTDVTPDQAGGVAGSEPSGTVLSLETHPRPPDPQLRLHLSTPNKLLINLFQIPS